LEDAETEAEGWTVINSLRGGAAGGGTRMRKGLDINVLSLQNNGGEIYGFWTSWLVHPELI
jgi:hypothetical protein